MDYKYLEILTPPPPPLPTKPTKYASLSYRVREKLKDRIDVSKEV